MSLLILKYVLHLAAILFLLSLSLRLGEQLDRFYNFAVGSYFTVCPFVWHSLIEQRAFPALLAASISALFVGALALLLELIVFSSLRSRVARPDVRMLTSIALSLIITNTVAIVWGNETRNLSAASTWKLVRGQQTFLTPLTVYILLIWLSVIAITLWVLRNTYAGKVFRAVASSSDLAKTFGINIHRVATISGVLAAVLAGIAGCLAGADTSISHTMGVDALLGGLAVAVLANKFSIGLHILCAILVAGLYCVVSYYLRVEWGSPIAFGLILTTFATRSWVSHRLGEFRA